MSHRKQPSVPKALRIPPDLYAKICELRRGDGLNEHAFLLKLLEKGIVAYGASDAEEKVRHMASQLDNLLKRK